MLLRFWDPIDQCCTFVLIVGPSVKVTETEQSRAELGRRRESSRRKQVCRHRPDYSKLRNVPRSHPQKKAFTHKEEGNRFVLKMS